MDVDALLEARSDGAPSGENLEYDEAFINMELAANPVAEPDAEDGAEAAEPDYGELARAAEAVLARSHDLRAAAFLVLAQIKQGGLEAARAPVAYIRGCLERHWDTCFPEVEDGDAVMRANAVVSLADPATVLSALRRAPLASGKTFGSISLRDILIADGEVAAPEGVEDLPTPDRVSAAFKDTPDDVLAARAEAARAISADLAAIEAAFEEKAPGTAPDLGPARDLLARMLRKMPAAAGAGSAAPASAGAATAASAASAPNAAEPAPADAGGDGAIRSPADVRAALDRIIAYYHRYEPSSPLPILLERAKRLVSADFLTIVRDMAPEGMENVSVVGGLQTEED